MAVIKTVRGKNAEVKLAWQGATVQDRWLAQIARAFDQEAAEILDDLISSIHVVSGDMRDKAFARVLVHGTKRTLTAGSTSTHAFYEEVAPNNHPQIRGVMDRHIPHISQKLAVARGRSR